MTKINPALIRILLRYGSMFLVTKGLLSPELGDKLSTDQDVLLSAELAVGSVMALGTEMWYYFRKDSDNAKPSPDKA